VKKIFYLIFISIFFFSPIAHAEIKNYSGFGEYLMSEFETLDVAKQRAKQKAARNAQEQAGVFVSSYTKIKNHQVTEDEIIAITNGILKIFDVKENLIPQDGGKNILIQVTIKASIDSDEINKWLEKGIEQRSELARQNEELRKAVAEQDKKIAELQKQIKNVKTQQDKEKITQEFKNEDKIFLSNQKVEDGNKFFEKKDYDNAINFYTQAIELNPNNEMAYIKRGHIFEFCKAEEYLAIADYVRAIEINPKNPYNYSKLAFVFRMLREYKKAIDNYNKAIYLNSDNSHFYYGRGRCYQSLGSYEEHRKAISDFDKAIQIMQLNPNIQNYSLLIAPIYYNRGNSNAILGNYTKAIDDYNKAIQLNFKIPPLYEWRGECYKALGDYSRAEADFAKAKELGYNP